MKSSLDAFRAEGRRVYTTSSFQTQCVPLLHLLSQHPGVSVVMIDTGYLFPETYDFAHQLQELLGFDFKRIRSTRTYSEQCTSSGALLHAHDVDACCRLNKVEPIEYRYLSPNIALPSQTFQHLPGLHPAALQSAWDDFVRSSAIR